MAKNIKDIIEEEYEEFKALLSNISQNIKTMYAQEKV